MKNYNFGNPQSEQLVKSTTLTASAQAVEIARFDVSQFASLSLTIGVTVAALTSLSVFARTDKNQSTQWMPISRTDFDGYGCTDASTDISRTAAGQSAIVTMPVSGWSEVRVDAASAGAAVTAATAGVE